MSISKMGGEKTYSFSFHSAGRGEQLTNMMIKHTVALTPSSAMFPQMM